MGLSPFQPQCLLHGRVHGRVWGGEGYYTFVMNPVQVHEMVVENWMDGCMDGWMNEWGLLRLHGFQVIRLALTHLRRFAIP
eukprot:356940-Chlamydomonas_euryale.AAC.2